MSAFNDNISPVRSSSGQSAGTADTSPSCWYLPDVRKLTDGAASRPHLRPVWPKGRYRMSEVAPFAVQDREVTHVIIEIFGGDNNLGRSSSRTCRRWRPAIAGRSRSSRSPTTPTAAAWWSSCRHAPATTSRGPGRDQHRRSRDARQLSGPGAGHLDPRCARRSASGTMAPAPSTSRTRTRSFSSDASTACRAIVAGPRARRARCSSVRHG